MSVRGVLMGALTLVALQVFVSNSAAYGSVGGMFDWAASAARRFLDPTVPAIPDFRSSQQKQQQTGTGPGGLFGPASPGGPGNPPAQSLPGQAPNFASATTNGVLQGVGQAVTV